MASASVPVPGHFPRQDQNHLYAYEQYQRGRQHAHEKDRVQQLPQPNEQHLPQPNEQQTSQPNEQHLPGSDETFATRLAVSVAIASVVAVGPAAHAHAKHLLEAVARRLFSSLIVFTDGLGAVGLEDAVCMQASSIAASLEQAPEKKNFPKNSLAQRTKTGRNGVLKTRSEKNKEKKEFFNPPREVTQLSKLNRGVAAGQRAPRKKRKTTSV